jgi:bifunctional N-acetylglucosamine-1-phosphate-uridyltransferase/glucosamine-1-phosphate-acetyltransferase GlmU-like protein
VDTVILAAGKGERLNGIAAPYHKPLLPVNGKPLVRNAVEIALQVTGCTPIVVVAPENALPIAQILEGEDAGMIVQRRANGPGHALMCGMQLVKSRHVLVLMGDNVLTFDDVDRVAKEQSAVGVQQVDPEDAERFTRVRTGGNWVEKVPITDEDINMVTGKVTCWVGPLKLETDITRNALARSALVQKEVPLGPPVLNAHQTEEHRLQLIAVDTYDIGVPEAWNGGHR